MNIIFICDYYCCTAMHKDSSSPPPPSPQVGRDKARPALSLVGYEEELRPAMAYVFGSTFVCDTLQDAKKVRTVCFHGF